MDPNDNLKRQLELARRLIEDMERPFDAQELGELVLSLDEWISKGGFLPAKWRIKCE